MQQDFIFDTHSHYDDEAFDPDRDTLLQGLAERGIGNVVSVGADLASSQAALSLAETYDFIYAALGIHPSETDGLTERDMDWIQENAGHNKVVAIGEIGLDHHWPEPAAEVQRRWFRRQVELAKEVKLPVIIHSREAAEETMKILTETKAYDCGGVIHCFSYSPEMAKQYVEMGFYIGVGGVVTFKNAKKLVQTVEEIPLEALVLETDCPYLAPEPYRGKRNDSSRLVWVAEKIAERKGIPVQEVIRTTTKNAKTLYHLNGGNENAGNDEGF